jgi:mono/diheme cytochrome c family protein
MIRLVGALLAAIALGTNASAETPVERGSYLVNGILTCGNCHTPRGPDRTPIANKALSGGEEFDTPAFKVTASNITPDRDTGIGAWSEVELKRALVQGDRPNGVPLAPIMPYTFYKVFTASDLDAVVAYLRSVPAIRNEVPPPSYKAAFRVGRVPGGDKPMNAADLADPVKRGFYLVTIGHCMECHTPMMRGSRDFEKGYGKGGFRFVGPWGESVARNITSHRTAGIGAWSDVEIKRAITQGVARDGSRLNPPMGYAWYARMTDADLDAIVAYLRTVPAEE